MPPASDRIRLSVIFLQYDRQKYSRSFERLVSLFAGFKSLDSLVVVVDNANPGYWQHEVSDRIVQIGGDNSAWEFSAFDRGLEFLAARDRPTDIYAFVTDAFLAYGDDYLELIDEATLRYCLELHSPVGWIDSFMQDLGACGYSYRDWMRTSLFFLPAQLLPEITPLTTPLEPEAIFGPTADSPFSESTPLSTRLREHLLAWLTKEESDITLNEVWHSQLELTDRSFDFFKAKTTAILREHLLSARLQAKGIACYDFRLIRRLAEANVDLAKTSKTERQGWKWLDGRDVKVAKHPRFCIEKYTAPRTIVHGNPSELKVIGWVTTEPQIREVTVRLSDGHEIGAACEVPRPDVIDALPEYWNELCGFELSANLDCLMPGTYEIEWAAPGFGLVEGLGKIDVLPKAVFDAQRCFVPDAAFPRQDIPVAVEGVLECSYPLRTVEILWDGKKTGVTPEFFELPRKSNGLRGYRVGALGEVCFSEAKLQHRLEIEFQGGLRNGARPGSRRYQNLMRYTWRHFQTIAAETTRPHTLFAREIGELDPKSGSVSIYIQGGVFASNLERRLALMWEGTTVYEKKLSTLAHARGPIAWFEIQQNVMMIPAGNWEFSLCLEQQDGPPEIFARWRDRVKLMEPVIHVEFLEARLPEKNPSHYFLGICGWIEHHGLIDRLLLKLDEEPLATLGINRFREDVAAHFGETLVRKRGFHADIAVNASPGDHVIQLVAVQENGVDVTWERPLKLEDRSETGFLLRSPTLDELENSNACSYWSSIAITGQVVSELKGIVATMEIDGKAADRQEVSGRFILSHTPCASGHFSVRVYFQHNARVLYDSGVNDASFVKIEMPPVIPAALECFIEEFEIRRYLNLSAAKDLAHDLAQLEREGLPEFFDMLRGIGVSLKEGKRGTSSISPARPGDRGPLKVLFACWEVPSSRHGGGVWMTNLLRQFHGKHEVTLIHAYGPGEEGWVDEIRPHVNKIISIPRAHQPALYRGDTRIPATYYDDYTPALRAAVESEVFAGGYDIVNHEYTGMYPHISRADVAQVLTVYENNFLAHLKNLSKVATSSLDATAKLLQLLKHFHFLTDVLPRACADIVGVTKEDTAILSDFQKRARIYLNTIGVETDFPAPKKIPKKFRRDRPVVVFLGNYRHPPNVEAAIYFVEKVMPGLRQKVPDLEFLIVGSHPTDKLKELNSKAGISVTGFVDDYRPYLFASNAFVAPIFTGAGMRVKILEAMACAIPVVGTGLSMNGVGAVDGEHYYRAESAADFIRAICRCLEYPKAARTVGRKGRKLIVERHSHERSARDREAIWHSAIDHWRREREEKPATRRRKLSLVRGNE